MALSVPLALSEAFNAATPKIVGGTESELGRFPWQTALLQKGFQYCGGSLIAPNVVLTAAHCSALTATEVALNCVDISDYVNNCEVLAVQEQIAFPGYDEATMFGDLMVVILKENSTVTPVTLAEAGFDLDTGDQGTVIGWGATNSIEQVGSDLLLEVAVDVVTNDYCDSQYREVFSVWTGQDSDAVDSLIDDSMICATDSLKDSCQGDSGGPFFLRCDNEENGDLQVGVVSWGFGCAYDGIPGVYQKVFTDVGFAFIKEQVEAQGHVLSTISKKADFCSGVVPTKSPAAPPPTPFPTIEGSLWTCKARFYGQGNACHCGCGMKDPDCDFTDVIVGCSSVANCIEGICLDPPTPAPTTLAPTTKSPTTLAPTTKAPTTVAPSTRSPTTVPPTTSTPTVSSQANSNSSDSNLQTVGAWLISLAAILVLFAGFLLFKAKSIEKQALEMAQRNQNTGVAPFAASGTVNPMLQEKEQKYVEL